jgi:hypothetical protein
MACGCKKNNSQTAQPVSINVSEVRTPAPTQPAPAKQ